MSLARRISLLCMGIAILSLAGAFAIMQIWIAAILILLVGSLMVLDAFQRGNRSNRVFLPAVVLLTAFEAIAGLPGLLLLLALVSSLATWDLDRFEMRMGPGLRLEPAEQENYRVMEKRHFRLLLVWLVIGGGGAAITLLVHMAVGYGMSLIVSILLIAVLGFFLRELFAT